MLLCRILPEDEFHFLLGKGRSILFTDAQLLPVSTDVVYHETNRTEADDDQIDGNVLIGQCRLNLVRYRLSCNAYNLIDVTWLIVLA